MQISTTTKISLILIVSIGVSCNEYDKNGGNHNKYKYSATSNVDTSSVTKKESSPIRFPNYESWQSFWTAFTTAAKNRDTATILRLTNFPFLRNGSLTQEDEFTELWISDVYDLRVSDNPALTSDLVLQSGEDERAILPKFDSVRVTNKSMKDFYFAKVNGYYRLVEIITPG